MQDRQFEGEALHVRHLAAHGSQVEVLVFAKEERGHAERHAWVEG